MKTNKTIKWKISVVVIILIVATLIMVNKSYWMALGQITNDSVMAQSEQNAGQRLEYHIWRIIEPNKKNDPAIVIVSVSPKHFNRKDMITLASELNKNFPEVEKLKVGLTDDADTARLFSQGLVNYPTYEQAERGRYYLDRNKCEEYINFSAQKNEKRETVKLNCNCK